uniref:Uncharacterized protein n=1 Tax=Sphaerodactylus townsendi TaxID=933632 RepID=A0ACB8F8Y0_9SAUR
MGRMCSLGPVGRQHHLSEASAFSLNSLTFKLLELVKLGSAGGVRLADSSRVRVLLLSQLKETLMFLKKFLLILFSRQSQVFLLAVAFLLQTGMILLQLLKKRLALLIGGYCQGLRGRS